MKKLFIFIFILIASCCFANDITLTGNIDITGNVFINPFRPIDIANCLIWLDGEDETTVFLNGSNVTQWNDKSGNGYHATQSTAALQPLYTTYGGKKTLEFNLDVLNLGALPSYSVGYTIFVVCRYNAVGGGSASMHPLGGSSKAFYKVGGTTIIRNNHITASVDHATNITTDPLIKIAYWDKVNLSAYFNGVLDANSVVTSTTLPAFVWYVGAILSNGVAGIQGNIFEIIIYTRALTDDERETVEIYLSDKWGIALS